MLKFLKNIKVSLKAAGPFAMLCIYLICFAAVAIFASPENFKSAMLVFLFVGGLFAGIANNWVEATFVLDKARQEREAEKPPKDKNNE